MKRYFKKSVMNSVLAASAFAFVASPVVAGDVEYDKRFEKNCQMKSTEFCKGAAQTLSKRDKWLPIVVHGGNETLYNAARNVAKRLINNGIRAYIVHAPEDDKIEISMNVDYYAKGGTKYAIETYDNDNITIKEVEDDLYSQAKKAYEYEYGKLKINNRDIKPD